MRAGSVVVLVVLAASLAYSQKNSNALDDSFITDPSLRAYLDHAPYQHGSLHGYEDGYQTGDIDFHLQRPQPDFDKVKQYHSGTRGYVDGDKDEYKTGYQDGYRLGYADALAGREFAAIERLQAAAEHKPIVVARADTPALDQQDDGDVATVKAFSLPIKVPTRAIFPSSLVAVLPPGPSPRDSALARIMNNLRRTFMPSMISPQAVVSATPR